MHVENWCHDDLETAKLFNCFSSAICTIYKFGDRVWTQMSTLTYFLLVHISPYCFDEWAYLSNNVGALCNGYWMCDI
jgi:hypothetical protein